MDNCSAVIFNGDGSWERKDNFDIPKPPEGGAVIAVEAVGLCHSDVAQLNGQNTFQGKFLQLFPVTKLLAESMTWIRMQNLGSKLETV